jgi:hypothetical protein
LSCRPRNGFLTALFPTRSQPLRVIAGKQFCGIEIVTAVPQLLYPGPQLPSGFFTKKKPPCTTLEWARELWNRSN